MAALVAEHLHVDRCDVLLYDRTTDELVLQVDSSMPTVPEVRVALGQGLTGLAGSGRRTIHVPDMRRDPRSLDLGDGVDYRSIIAVPIVE